jgi:SAM-dependent methyltransferase
MSPSSNSAGPVLFDRALVKLRRGRALAHAGQRHPVMQSIAVELLDRLASITRNFEAVLLLGAAGTGLAQELKRRSDIRHLVCCELCPVGNPGDRPAVIADEEELPFGHDSFDLILAGPILQWTNDLPGTLIQLRHALKPDGLLLAALAAGATLTELRQALIAAESEFSRGAGVRTGPFADIRALGDLLARAGFALPVADADRLTLSYRDPLHLIADIRSLGATNMLARDRSPALTRTVVGRMIEFYHDRFPAGDGRIVATAEIAYLTGWKPAPGQPKPLRPGSARVSLADALGAEERHLPERTPDDKPG